MTSDGSFFLLFLFYLLRNHSLLNNMHYLGLTLFIPLWYQMLMFNAKVGVGVGGGGLA